MARSAGVRRGGDLGPGIGPGVGLGDEASGVRYWRWVVGSGTGMLDVVVVAWYVLLSCLMPWTVK